MPHMHIGGTDTYLHPFLTSIPGGSEWSTSLYPQERTPVPND